MPSIGDKRKMKYFKKVSTLLITLMVISMVAGACAVNTTTDNSKTIHYIPTRSVDKTSSKTKIIYVAKNGNDKNNGLTTKKPKKTIQNAINTARSGDTIQIAKGTYKENLKIRKNITLNGNNQKDTIIDGQGYCCAIILKGIVVTISHFTLQNGCSPGINNHGKLNIKSSTIIKNKGLALFNDGTLSIKDSKITKNNAGITNYPSGKVDIYNSKITSSGGISNGGIMNIKKAAITNNTADDGGGIWNCGKLTLKDSTIANNIAGKGGGIYSDNGGVYLDNSTINNNTAFMGSGIYSESVLKINNSKINNNFAESDGGGIYSVGTLNIINSIISYNTVRYHPPSYDGLRGSGGGIYCWGATIKNSTITKNSACFGGGIYNRYELLAIDNLSHITLNKPDNIKRYH
jgi:predicted outer membrane repeat protein